MKRLLIVMLLTFLLVACNDDYKGGITRTEQGVEFTEVERPDGKKMTCITTKVEGHAWGRTFDCDWVGAR